jgi:hypothetical protein
MDRVDKAVLVTAFCILVAVVLANGRLLRRLFWPTDVSDLPLGLLLLHPRDDIQQDEDEPEIDVEYSSPTSIHLKSGVYVIQFRC